MSKAGLFGVLVLWLVVVTYIVNAFVVFDPSTDLAVFNPVEVFEQDDGGVLSQSASLLSVFWKALTFRIEGLPVLFNLFFQVPTTIIGYMILAFLRGSN